MTPFQHLLSKFPSAKRAGSSWEALCPVHDDQQASLSITEGENGRALMHCHAGCSFDKICAAINLEPSELFPMAAATSTFNGNRSKSAIRSNTVERITTKPRGSTFTTADEAVAELERRYGPRSTLRPYHTAEGKIVGLIVRWDLSDGKKKFRPVSLIGERWHLAGMPELRPLYGLPEILAAETVYVCEGEKAADAVRSLGLTATTSAHGSQAAKQTDWRPLAGKSVVILPDNDVKTRAGFKYAETVAAILGKLEPAPTIKVLELPGLPDKGDAVEWIAARVGQTKEMIRAELQRLVDETGAIEAEPTSRERIDSQPIVVRLCDVKPEPVRWLWRGRIAIGKLTIISGDPGLGKSFLSCDLAARVSTGRGWPDDVLSNAPLGGVVMLNCEDDLADTIRPRLDKHGADVTKIVALAGVRDPLNDDRERQFNLARDLPALERAVRDMGDCRLVVIDPLTAYLGDKHDSHKAADVRSLLAPLAALAAKYGVAVVGISHLNKGSGAAMYRTMGSLAFVAAARAVWCVTKDQENPTRRLFLPVKNNLGNDLTGLAYSIVDGVVAWESDPIEVSADDAMDPDAEDAPRTERAAATAWLRGELIPGTPAAAKIILSDAREHGISERQLRRAASRLGVVIAKTSMRGGWTWTLPQDDEGPTSPNRESSASSQKTRESSDRNTEDGRQTETGMFDAEGSGTWGDI